MSRRRPSCDASSCRSRWLRSSPHSRAPAPSMPTTSPSHRISSSAYRRPAATKLRRPSPRSIAPASSRRLPRADRARDRGRSCRDRPGRDSPRCLSGARGAPAQLQVPCPRSRCTPTRTGTGWRRTSRPGVALRRLLHLDPGPDREQDDAPAGSGVADPRARTALPRDGRGSSDRMADLGHHQRADVDAGRPGVPSTHGRCGLRRRGR